MLINHNPSISPHSSLPPKRLHLRQRFFCRKAGKVVPDLKGPHLQKALIVTPLAAWLHLEILVIINTGVKGKMWLVQVYLGMVLT